MVLIDLKIINFYKYADNYSYVDVSASKNNSVIGDKKHSLNQVVKWFNEEGIIDAIYNLFSS